MLVSFNTYNYKAQNFTGRDDVRRKSNAFCDELLAETSSEIMPSRKVPQIIRKHIPKQLSIKAITPKDKDYSSVGGVYRADILFNLSRGTYQTKNRVMLLRKPESTDKKSIDRYLSSVAHEVTHVFQSFDKDIRDDKVINKALANIPAEQWGDMADTAYTTFAKIEKEILFPMIYAHRNVMYYNSATPFCTHVDRETMKKIVDAKLNAIKSDKPNINMEFLKKIMYLQAMNEFDAYTTEEKVFAKLNPSIKESDFIPYLYLCLADCLEVEGVE